MVRTVFRAILALGICFMFGMGLGAVADGKTTTLRPAPAGPAAPLGVKANRPGTKPDIYCTHDSNNHNFQACGDSFKQKCEDIGGTLNDPTGNPDYGACIHDDVW